MKETIVRSASLGIVSEEPVLPPIAVARLIGVAAGALGHHGLQDGPAALAGLLAHHLTDQGGLGALDDRSAGVGDRLGPHRAGTGFPPVDDGGESGDHLERPLTVNRCPKEAVARGQIALQRGEILPLPHQADLLAGQVDAGSSPSYQRPRSSHKFLRPQPLADHHKGGVAGVPVPPRPRSEGRACRYAPSSRA